jgi:hypothetical protein
MAPVAKISLIRRPHFLLVETAHSYLALAQALHTFRPPIHERVGMKDLQAPRGTNLKEGLKGVVGAMGTITIGETGTTGEMEAGEGGGEGGEVVITEVGMIDPHNGTMIVMTDDRSPPGDMRSAGEVDQGAPRRGVPDMGVFHGGTNEQGALPAQTDADSRPLHNQLP